MEPISAIVGVSAIGYLFDQFLKKQNYNEQNYDSTSIPVSDINPCAEQYPWNYIETAFKTNTVSGQNYDNNNNNLIENFQNNQNSNDSSLMSPQQILSPQILTAKDNSGQPELGIPPYYINTNQRPVDDFAINNMVPFFAGTSTKQDMRGTGVAQANVNSDNFNLGNNGLTPNYTTLATFTGYDNTYLHKREVPNMFSPNEQRDRSNLPIDDVSAQRPLLDRYTNSLLTKNDEAPFEKLMVGPGINVSSQLPNDGQGYNSGLTQRVMPPNVGAYKLNSHAGRVTGLNWQGAMNPTALPGTGPAFENNQNTKEGFQNANQEMMYGVPSKNKTPYYTLEDRPLTGTPALTQAPMRYSEFVLPSGTSRSNNRVEFGATVKVN